MNGVERVRAYLSIPTEAPAVLVNHRPPPSWPSHGHIAVQDLVVRYRPDLPPVLHGLSFEVSAGEKIGIAGRTGCGKVQLVSRLPWGDRAPCRGAGYFGFHLMVVTVEAEVLSFAAPSQAFQTSKPWPPKH